VGAAVVHRTACPAAVVVLDIDAAVVVREVVASVYPAIPVRVRLCAVAQRVLVAVYAVDYAWSVVLIVVAGPACSTAVISVALRVIFAQLPWTAPIVVPAVVWPGRVIVHSIYRIITYPAEVCIAGIRHWIVNAVVWIRGTDTRGIVAAAVLGIVTGFVSITSPSHTRLARYS
jgi:hypothetical protein